MNFVESKQRTLRRILYQLYRGLRPGATHGWIFPCAIARLGLSEQEIQKMDERLTGIFREADQRGESPVEAARRMVERRLAKMA